jgi:hypothetical protein
MTERVTVEQNGERITLEVPDGTSDEQIQSFLAGGKTSKSAEPPAKGPGLETAELAASAMRQMPQPGVIGSAVNMAKDIGLGPAMGAVKGYTVPKLATDILTTQFTGIPAFVAKGAIDTGKEYYNALKDYLGQPKTITPEAEAAIKANPIIDKLNGDQLRKLREAASAGNYDSVAGEKWASTKEGKALLDELRTLEPTMMTKVGRVAGPILKTVGQVATPALAGYEGIQGIKQAQHGQYTPAALSGLSAASMFAGVPGMIAQPGIAMMQNAAQNFQQQTPQQQQESAMAALSGQAPGQYGEALALSQPPTAANFMERIKALSKQYGMGQQ